MPVPGRRGGVRHGRDGQGAGISIPYIPFDLNLGGGVDNRSVPNTFAAVLTRGHKYRLQMTLTCSVFSDGGLDVGSECDYMDSFFGGSGGGPGWSDSETPPPPALPGNLGGGKK